MKHTRYYQPIRSYVHPIEAFLNTPTETAGRLGGFFERIGQKADLPVEFDQDSNHYFVRAKLPGVSKEQIRIELKERILQIEVRVGDGEDADVIQRRLRLPDALDLEAVSAKHVDGLLTVELPKSSEPAAREIEIGS